MKEGYEDSSLDQGQKKNIRALEKAMCSDKWWAERKRGWKCKFLHSRHFVKMVVENEMATGHGSEVKGGIFFKKRI